MLELLDTFLIPTIILALVGLTAANLILAGTLYRQLQSGPEKREQAPKPGPSLKQKLFAAVTPESPRRGRIVVNSDEAVALRERAEKAKGAQWGST